MPIREQKSRDHFKSRTYLPLHHQIPIGREKPKKRKIAIHITGNIPIALLAGCGVSLIGGLLLLTIICPILNISADPAAGTEIAALASFAVGAFCGGITISRILCRRAVWQALAVAIAINAVAFLLSSAASDCAVDTSPIGWLKRGMICLLYAFGAYIAVLPKAGGGRNAKRTYKKHKNR